MGITELWWPIGSWLVVGGTTTALMAVATRFHPLADKTAWLELAGATAVFSVAEVVHHTHPMPPVRLADAFFIPGFLLTGTAFRRLTRDAGGHARGWDAAVMAVGLAALLITLVVGHAHTGADSSQVLAFLYPLVDLVLLTMAIQAAHASRNPSSWLLAAGTMWLLAAALIIAVHGHSVDTWTVPLRIGFLTCWGVAALWPSARAYAQPDRDAQPPIGLFMVVVLLAPTAILIQAAANADTRQVVFGVACAVSGLFVVAELHAVRREQAKDPVTRLPNLVALLENADTEMANGSNPTLFIVDLARFHVLHEILGHHSANQVLRHLGRHLSRDTSKAFVARGTADRFVILAPPIGDAADPASYATHLIDTVTAPMEVNGERRHLDCYVSYATANDAHDADELLTNADIALHIAKESGPGTYTAYDPDQRTALTERTRLVTELRQGIDAGELFLEYQPIVALADDTIEGFEALVRWQHPRLGRLGPDRFVPLAESSGLIAPIGIWVLRQALADAVTLNDAAARRIFVDVNVSPVQLEPQHVAELVEALTKGLGPLDPSTIVLEATESAFGSDNRRLLEQVTALKTPGIRLAIDDFGTGYSSLARLRELPIDIIKIDKSFVTGLSPGATTRMIEGILQIINALDLTAVAEGVETQSERDLLLDLGCRFAQGYFYSKPVQLNEAIAMVTA